MKCRLRPNREMRRVDRCGASVRIKVGVFFCVVAHLAWSQEEPPPPEGSIELGLGYSDNLNHDADELSSDIVRLAVGFVGRSDQRWVRTALAADIEYLKYGADGLVDDDELLGSVDGALELHAVPDIVQWNVRYDYGQVRIDPLGATGLSNRQRTTSFSTGPQINLSLAERTLLQAGALVSEQSFEQTRELDGRLTAVRVALARQIDPVTRFTLAIEDSETEYDLGSETYNIETLSLEYERELASGEAFASIGRGRVEVDQDSEPTTVTRLQWRRAVGARSQIEICAGREITDAGSLFAGAGVAADCPGDFSSLSSVARTTDSRLQEVVSTTSPLVRAGGSVSFEVDGILGSFRATFSMTEDRFEGGSTYDNDSTIVEISGSREFARNWRAEVTARRWVQDFIDLGDENEDRFVSLSLSRLLARSMRLTLSFEQNRRVGGVGPFDENRYFLAFGRDFWH